MILHAKLSLLVTLAFTVEKLAVRTAGHPPYKVVCYFTSWAVYRSGNSMFDVEDIDPDLCTHHIYLFAGLNESSHEIYSLDPYRDLNDNYGSGAYLRFTGMKRSSPQIKTMLSIGGWSEGSMKYSQMAATAENRATFVESVVDFLAKYNFDGLDMAWEYPTLRGGSPQDRGNFVLLMKELSNSLRPRGMLLSAAFPYSQQIIEPAYDLPALREYLDFLNVMSFNYHKTDVEVLFLRHGAPLYLTQKDVEHGEPYTSFNVNYTMNYYLQGGIEPSKLMMGVPLYEVCFDLQNPSKHAPYDLSGGFMDCPYTGCCQYNELCDRMFSEIGWTDVHDGEMQATYSYNHSNWVGWDDADTVKAKLEHLKSIGIGGALLWSIDMDDFRGLCGQKYPITSLIWSELNRA